MSNPRGNRLMSIPVDQLFWSIVQPDLSHNDCWEWPKSRTLQGYGQFCLKEANTAMAHRVAYLFAFGELPSGKDVCHTCDNPPCCRPSHLFIGTPLENITDCILKGRFATGPGSHTKGRWARDYDACLRCQGTDSKHYGRGHCLSCYRIVHGDILKQHLRNSYLAHREERLAKERTPEVRQRANELRRKRRLIM